MKTQRNNVKNLKLNKVTVLNLNAQEQASVRGGDPPLSAVLLKKLFTL